MRDNGAENKKARAATTSEIIKADFVNDLEVSMKKSYEH